MLLLIFTSIVGLSLTSPLIIWGIIELNLLLFVPILGLIRKNNIPSILRIKYFFIQSLASVILFVRVILIRRTSWRSVSITVMLSGRLIWKLGIPPLHLWLFNVIVDLDWVLFFITTSWQKILPFYFLRQTIVVGVDFFILFSLYVSIRASLIQVRIKKILILSSVFTRAWVLASILTSKSWWVCIFLLYRIILFFCILILHNNKIGLLERNNSYTINIQEKLNVFFLLLSMAGLPPFLGFFIKLLVLLIAFSQLKGLISLLIVIASVLIIYIYLRIFLRSIIRQTLHRKNFFFFKTINWAILILMVYIVSPILFFLW